MPKLPTPAPNTVGKTAPSVVSTRRKRRGGKVRSSKASVTAKPATRRQDPIFASALNALAERYTKAINERAKLGYQLAMLNAEIPALEASMQALNSQLHPQAPPVVVDWDIPPQTFQAQAQRSMAEALPLPPRMVPSDLSAQALRRYGAGVAGGNLKGMGSIPASVALKGRRTAPGPIAVEDPLEQPIDGAEIAGDVVEFEEQGVS